MSNPYESPREQPQRPPKQPPLWDDGSLFVLVAGIGLVVLILLRAWGA